MQKLDAMSNKRLMLMLDLGRVCIWVVWINF
jgi:hypothetical protein